MNKLVLLLDELFSGKATTSDRGRGFPSPAKKSNAIFLLLTALKSLSPADGSPSRQATWLSHPGIED